MIWILAAAAVGGLILLARVDASVLARLISRYGPWVLFGLGAVLGARGLLLLAVPMFVAAGLWLRSRSRSRPVLARRSTVRSAALEMELDRETGAMNGLVLVGRFEGLTLDEMDREDLNALREEVATDPDSGALLDAYFDRRFPGGREDAQSDADAGAGGPTGSGPMSEQQAYEVLGLAPGAGTREIREAHRRLMKGAHPDRGGTTDRAARINEAKDVLLGAHGKGPDTQN